MINDSHDWLPTTKYNMETALQCFVSWKALYKWMWIELIESYLSVQQIHSLSGLQKLVLSGFTHTVCLLHNSTQLLQLCS